MRLVVLSILVLASCRRQPEPVGGCRYEERRGTCTLLSVESGPANSDDPSLVEVTATYQWTGELPPQFHDKTSIVRWNVPQDELQNARAHAEAHREVACTADINVGGSCPPDGPRIDQGALPPPPFAR